MLSVGPAADAIPNGQDQVIVQRGDVLRNFPLVRAR